MAIEVKWSCEFVALLCFQGNTMVGLKVNWTIENLSMGSQFKLEGEHKFKQEGKTKSLTNNKGNKKNPNTT